MRFAAPIVIFLFFTAMSEGRMLSAFNHQHPSGSVRYDDRCRLRRSLSWRRAASTVVGVNLALTSVIATWAANFGATGC